MSETRVCTQCGFTYAEFRARGLLGCPECYAQLGPELWEDLLQMHPDLYRRPAPPLAPEAGSDLAGLQEMLSDALRGERYEEAASLRRRLLALGAAS